jgi:hypothetical protein
MFRQAIQFSGDNDWVFASPVKLGRLPVSLPVGVEAFQGNSERTHFDTVSSWLDAVGTGSRSTTMVA